MSMPIRIICRVCLLCWSTLAFAGAAWSDDYDVYLMAGQSNMDGRGDASALGTDDAQPIDNAIIFYRNPPYSSEGWQPLATGFSVPPKFKSELPSSKFGPEIGFARAMQNANPDQKIALIKGSKGGTNLRADWNPGEPGKPESQGPQYRNFIETIEMATAAMKESKHSFTIRGLLWHQGEADFKIGSQKVRAPFEQPDCSCSPRCWH